LRAKRGAVTRDRKGEARPAKLEHRESEDGLAKSAKASRRRLAAHATTPSISDSTVKQPKDARSSCRGAIAPGFCKDIALDVERGRREGRALAAPVARLQQKSRRHSPQVWPRQPGLPCAMVLTLMARSPWEPGFLAPIARSVRHASKLGLSVGRPGPHAFAVRIGIVRPRATSARCDPIRPSHPALNVRDDREAPLWIECGTVRIMLLTWGRRQVRFWKSEHTTLRHNGTTGSFAHNAHA